MYTTTNGETIDGKLDTRAKDARENDTDAPTKSAGDPACSSCGGAGVTRKREGMWLVATPCACAHRRQLADAIQRCWPADVIKAARFKPAASVLTGRTGMNLWVRAERDVLAAHLARALPELGRIELVRIASDADLATAWLARAGDKVRDEEVREAMSRDDEDRFERLVDLAAPPALLIVQLGVKAAALKDLPGLVIEAIHLRQQRGRPTWVVDTATKPLAPGHLAYSEEIARLLAMWPQVRISSVDEEGGKVDLTATAGKKKEKTATVHPEIETWLDKHGISDYTPQGDRDKGVKIDHMGSTVCGPKSVSVFWNKQRRSPTGVCGAEDCPTKGKAAAAEDFLPSAKIKAQRAGKTIGAQDLAARLRELLSDGTPRPQSEVKRQLLEAGTYSDETLKRARRLAGVIASDASGAWTWQLPTSHQDRSTPP